jgi:hypothetical protein
MSSLSSAFPLRGSAGSLISSYNTSTQYDHFMDVHVIRSSLLGYIFRLRLMMYGNFFRLCGFDNPAKIFLPEYLSELDAVAWRFSLVDALVSPFAAIMVSILSQTGACSLSTLTGIFEEIPEIDSIIGFLTQYCAGSWGGVYPRVGRSHTVGEPTAALLAGYKALRVISDEPAVINLRVVLFPDHYKRWGLFQFVWGHKGGAIPSGVLNKVLGNCVPVGAPPVLWSWGKSMLEGQTGYILIWWERTSCCKPTTMCFGFYGL